MEGPPKDFRDLVGAISGTTTGNFFHSNRIQQPGAVPQYGVEDNPPDCRAHGSKALGSSNPISEEPTSNQFAHMYVFKNFTIQCNTEGTSNRASESLRPKMDDVYARLLGSANCSGLPHRIYESPSAAFFSRNAQPISFTGDSSRSGNERVVSQGSHSSNSDSNPIKRGIHKLYVHSPKKGWGQLPSYKFKATKSVPSLRTFQEYVERSFETRRLCCKDRPQGCIPNCTNLERSSKIPAISSEGSTTRICFPPLWVNHSPQGVHKVDETSSSCFKTTGHSCDNLLGRYTNHGRITSLSIVPCSFNFESPRGPRIYSQPPKVPVNSFSRYRIF